AVGSGAWLLGSSNPIRDADLAPLSAAAGPVFANRGLAGIDGTLATAFGIALARKEPLTVLCGDLTFLHDANALAIGPTEPTPDVRIVVADDSGGSIFATLEYGQERFAGVFERVFATDPGVDVVALARGYGVPARRVESLEALAEVVASPVRGVEVVAVSVDREHRRGLMEALNACAFPIM
ncbi:MAG: thiamine pyrophosphate-binding protein, partial [Propionicimonas sp.]